MGGKGEEISGVLKGEKEGGERRRRRWEEKGRRLRERRWVKERGSR